MQGSVERREFQRLLLELPTAAKFAGQPATLIEIGILGARLRHDGPLPQSGALQFRDGERELELGCELVRTEAGESAVRFVSAAGESGDFLRQMLARLVEGRMRGLGRIAWDTIGPGIDGDRTVRGRDAGFVCYRLDGGIWSRRRLFLPEQPQHGFTVAKGVDRDEMQQLCRVYQGSDEEGRRLIRLFAELSVSEAMGIPPAE